MKSIEAIKEIQEYLDKTFPLLHLTVLSNPQMYDMIESHYYIASYFRVGKLDLANIPMEQLINARVRDMLESMKILVEEKLAYVKGVTK